MATEKQSEPEQSPFKSFEALYDDYIRELGEIWDELTRQVRDAQTACYESGAEAARQDGDLQRAQETALREYVEAVRVSWEESQKRYSDAYARYVEAYRNAWTSAEPPELSPQAMAIIAESASTAARYAASTIGNWSLIGWAGVPPWLMSMARRD